MDLEKLYDRVDRALPKAKLGDLADTFFWAPILRASMLTGPSQLLNALGLREQNGVIFSGADGNGRHTTAEALAASLCDPKAARPYHFLRLSGWELDFEKSCEVDALMDAIVGCGQKSGNLCILLDSPEDSPWGLKVQHRLAELLNTEEFHFYLILICGEPKEVASELRRRLRVCHCPPPTDAKREIWFADNLFTSIPLPVKSMTYFDLAKRTDGLSWRQLSDFVNAMRLLLAWRHFLKYHENGCDISSLEKSLQEGSIELDEEDISLLLRGVSGHDPMPYAGQIPQMQAADAAQVDIPLPDRTLEAPDLEHMRKLADLKKHPERMTIDQFLDF